MGFGGNSGNGESRDAAAQQCRSEEEGGRAITASVRWCEMQSPDIVTSRCERQGDGEKGVEKELLRQRNI